MNLRGSIGEKENRVTRRRLWLRFFASCALVALVAVWLGREPRYQGRSLSNWLDTYDAILSGKLTEPGFEETRKALRHFANKGLSYYTARLAYEPPSWQVSMLKYMREAPGRLGGIAEPICRFGQAHIDIRERRAKTALLAFELLGHDAASAIPGLERLASGANPYSAQRAISALSYLGPRGLEALARIVANGNPATSAAALKLLSNAGPGSEVSLPSFDVDEYDAHVLGCLLNSARFSNRVTRLSALRSLAAYDHLEELICLLNDTNPIVRADVTNVLAESTDFFSSSLPLPHFTFQRVGSTLR